MSAATELAETLRVQSLELEEPVVTLPLPTLISRRGATAVPAEKLRAWLDVSITVHGDPWSSTEEVLQAAANDIVRDPQIDSELVGEFEQSLEAHGHGPQEATDIVSEWLTCVTALRTWARPAEDLPAS